MAETATSTMHISGPAGTNASLFGGASSDHGYVPAENMAPPAVTGQVTTTWTPDHQPDAAAENNNLNGLDQAAPPSYPYRPAEFDTGFEENEPDFEHGHSGPVIGSEDYSRHYELRASARDKHIELPGGVDHDESGNYDPEAEKQAEIQRRALTRLRRQVAQAKKAQRENAPAVDTLIEEDSELEPGDADESPIPMPSVIKVDFNMPCQKLTIRTSFAHPMTFLCENTPHQFSDPYRLCDFHRVTNLSINGYGFVKIRVQEMHGRLCYEERSRRGHWEKGRLPTRLCGDCTMERFRIVCCPHSSIELMPPEEVAAIAYDFHHNRGQCTQHDICNFCVSPVAYKCTVPYTTDMWGQELGSVQLGCGLQLCGDCMDELCVEHNGKVQDMLRALKPRKRGQKAPVRADAELLWDDGLLARNVWASVQ